MPIKPTPGTQEAIVLRHIKRKRLSPMQAFVEYEITDLAGRIHNLEKKGWKIAHNRVAKYDENGKEITHWTEYKIA